MKLLIKIAFSIHFQLGIRTPFGREANFKNIGLYQENLKISNVFQKTSIGVTEGGTVSATAAAAAPATTGKYFPNRRIYMGGN